MDSGNTTRGQNYLAFVKDRDGREYVVSILKYTFRTDAQGRVELDEESAASPYLLDEYNGEDAATASIRKPSDLFLFRPGTEVILLGHAQPQNGTTSVDVTLRVGPIAKTVRASGLRVWKAGAFGGVVPGPALPMREPVPLIYELAWGGMDLSDPSRPVGEPRNYCGRGVARDPRKLIGEPAALLEDPARPIGGSSGVPWCFGAIHRHWQPRAQYAGTYDEAWMQSRMPLLPVDFSDKFNISVPPEQWSELPLTGAEPIEVTGATPARGWRLQLPRIAPGFSSLIAGVRAEHRTHLDSILIDADAQSVELTWRAAVPVPRKYEMIEKLLVFEKGVL